MLRALNFFCVALAALSCLALYHVSEQTRVTRVHLNAVNHQIVQERDAMSVLQAEWERVASPERIQQLAQQQGLDDASSVQLASLDVLPRRGQDENTLGVIVRNASDIVPVKPQDPRIHTVSMRTGY